jgi:hypothetical protein
MDGSSPVRRSVHALEGFETALRLVVLLNLFDAFATLLWLHLGHAAEGNPVMAGALEGGIGPFLLSKIGLVSLSVVLLWRLRERVAARAAFVPLAALYAFVGGHHLGWAALQGGKLAKTLLIGVVQTG